MERVVVEALDKTRVVMGIASRVVRGRVYFDDVLLEDTHDWFAHDDAGNVWYMGEAVDNCNYDENGQLVDIMHEGAWEAGEHIAGTGQNAQPGLAMEATLAVSNVYHQEHYPGEDEDMGEVVALEVDVTLGDGTANSCLQTRDSTPFDPDANEYRYYATGIRPVLEEPVGGGERLELVEVTP